MNKLLVVLLCTIICVARCSEEQEAIDFIKHLNEISSPDRKSIKYWSGKIFKVAEDQPKDASSLIDVKPYVNLRKKLAENVTSEPTCFKHLFSIRLALELL